MVMVIMMLEAQMKAARYTLVEEVSPEKNATSRYVEKI